MVFFYNIKTYEILHFLYFLLSISSINCTPKCYSTACSQCSDASSKGCTLCSTSYYMYNGDCLTACPNGYYANNSSMTCAICSASCLTCTGVANSNCNSCASGMFLYQQTCLSVCPSNTYVNGSNCPLCDTSCLTCSGNLNIQCLSCSSGNALMNGSCLNSCPDNYYNNSNGICQTCSNSCLTCNGPSASNCNSCATGKLLYNNVCYYSCPSNTYASGSNCQLCDSSCLTCSGSLNSQCISCNGRNGKALMNGSCLNSCPYNYYNNSNGICQTCSNSCLTCNGPSASNCNSCATGKLLYNNICYDSCPSNTYASGSNCQICDSSCLTCLGSLNTQCVSCNGGNGKALINGSCLNSCPDNYYNDSFGICQTCSNSCLTCNGPSAINCESCKAGVFLYENSCYNACPSYTYINGNNCELCDNSCLTCLGSLSYQCLSCSSGKVFINGSCMKSCPNNYYNDSIRVCQICDNTCLTCSGPTNNQCLSCSNNQFFYNINKSCNSNCPYQYYANLTSQICQNCDITCGTCTGPSKNQCLTCNNNLFYDGLTLSCNGNCPIGYYGDSDTNNICRQCDPSCENCDGLTNTDCLSCNSNLFYLSSNKTCNLNCPIHYYGDSSNICQSCDNTCETCIGFANNQNQCLSCRYNLYFDSLTNTCKANCPNNYYGNAANNTCMKCDFSCNTCDGPSNINCLSCNNGLYYLSSNKSCITQCLFHYYGDSAFICQECDNTCETCSGPNDTQCLSCDGNLYYNSSKNTCNANCPNNFYPSNNICIQCDVSCETCDGPSDLNCLSCENNLFYYSYNRSCLSNCPNNYYPDNNTCKSCDSSCETCNEPTTCLSCKFSYYLEKSNFTCGEKCLSNEFKNDLTSECQSCDSSCEKCSGPSNSSCITCPLYSFLNSQNQCTQTCPSHQFGNILSNICETCADSCLECYGRSDSNCLSCSRDYTLNNSMCVKQCNSSTNCSTCDSDLSCLTCELGYYLTSQNKCLDKCPIGEYVEDIYNKICGNCDISCQTCNGSSALNCLTCNSGYNLKDSGCYSICSSSQYFDNNQRICIECDSHCLTCNGPSSSNCLSCDSSSILLNNSQCCLSSEYLDMNDGLCKSCDSSCLTCNGPNNSSCLSCNTSYFLKDNTCVKTCDFNQYLDISLRKCISCDDSCNSCIGLSNTSCKSCKNNTFLLNSSCFNQCPYDYSTDYINLICNKIVPKIISASILEIDNPYKFLIVFGNNNDNVNISFTKSLKLELLITPLIEISNYPEKYTYSILPSGINSSSFLLNFLYLSQNVPLSSSLMKISFIQSNDPNYIVNMNISLKLLSFHQCESNQYFLIDKSECIDKIIIDYSWKYTSEPNQISLIFSNINERIKSLILSNSLLIISIQGYKYLVDYTYNFQLESLNTITLILIYYKEVVGGALLSLSFNQSIYQLIAYENSTTYLKNTIYAIKLFDYYFLSEAVLAAINQTTTMASIGSQASSMAVYASVFLSPGSSFAIRGLLLLTIIQLLRYVGINYPPNVFYIFRNDDNKLIVKDKIIQDSFEDQSMPALFVFYDVSGSLINNLGEDFLMLIIIITTAFLVACLISLKLKIKIIDLIIKLFKSIFIWSMTIMILLSKYIKVCLFLFIFLRFNLASKYEQYDLACAIFCLIYIIWLPMHVFLIIKRIEMFPEQESQSKVSTIITIDKYIKPTTLPLSKINKVFAVGLNAKLKTIEEEKSPHEKIDLALVRSNQIVPVKESITKAFTAFETFFDMKSDRRIIINKEINIPSHNHESSNHDTNYSNGEQDIINSSTRKFINNNGKRGSLNQQNTLKLTEIDDETEHEKESSKLKEKKNLGSREIINAWDIPLNMNINNAPKQEETQSSAYLEENNINSEGLKSNKIASYEKTDENNNKKEIWDGNVTLDHNKIIHIKNVKSNGMSKYWKILICFLIKPIIFGLKYMKSVYNPKNSKEFCYRYRILMKGIRKLKGVIKFYFFIDLLRYFSLTFFVIFFIGYPMAQICLLEAVSLIVLIFVTKKKPFELKIDSFISIIKECLINSAFISAIILACLDNSGNNNIELRMNLGWSIIFSYMALMYSLVFNTFQKIIRLLYLLLKTLCLRYKKE